MKSSDLSSSAHEEILRISNISKQFPGVQALRDVSFSVKKGEVHGLVGANGAGKSTLNKIIAGVIQPEEGEIYLNGEPILPLNPRKAQDLGIQVIHQDLNLAQEMSVMDNIFLGYEFIHHGVFVDKAKVRRESQKILDELGVSINPDEKVKKLSVSLQQMVAVAAALQRRATVLVFDETTATITREESAHLFDKIRILKAKGLGMIYVSHQLEEIFEICDRVTILRDGKYMGTKVVKDTSKEEIISLMVGFKLTEQFPERKAKLGDVLLSVDHLSMGSAFKDISFQVRSGEILGFYGLVGSGRTEIFTTIFGVQPFTSGKVQIKGRDARINKPAEAVASGMGFMPEDRKKQGVLLSLSVLQNITLPSIRKICRNAFINQKRERQIVNSQVKNLNIATPTVEKEVRYLSGGNQQKVVLAKWLVTNSSILVLDQPTRGIDVHAKTEIYKLINDLALKGHAIIMISDELQEVIGMCDKIIVMHEGQIRGVVSKEKATQHELLKLANGTI